MTRFRLEWDEIGLLDYVNTPIPALAEYFRAASCWVNRNVSRFVPEPAGQDGNGVGALYRDLTREFCQPNQDRPGFPPTPVFFDQGACPCVRYLVYATIVIKTPNGGDQVIRNNELIGEYLGGIRNVTFLQEGGTTRWGYTSTCNGQRFNFSSSATGFNEGLTRITRIELKPGQVDCGENNIPEQIIEWFQNEDNRTFIFDYTDGDGIDFAIPFVMVNAPVSLSFPFRFDAGGITLEVNIDGIEFNFTNNNNFDQPSNRDIQDEIRDGTKDNPPVDEDNPDPEEEEDNESNEARKNRRIGRVDVILSTLPDRNKSYSGAASQDVHFAGWFCWIIGNSYLPREPINFERSSFVPPVPVEGYAYTFTNGARGSAIVYYTQE